MHTICMEVSSDSLCKVEKMYIIIDLVYNYIKFMIITIG